MKNILLIFSFIVSVFSVCSQVVKPQVGSKPATVNMTISKPTVTGNDLTVSITGISYQSGTYHISYTVKNNGSTVIDMNNVILQAHIITADGGYLTPAGGEKLMNIGLLKSGQEYKSNTTYAGKNLIKGQTYKYLLRIDESKVVSEVNENNNTAEYAITGYTDAMEAAGLANLQLNGKINTGTASVPLQYDLTIVSATIFKKGENNYEVQFVMKNIGNADLKLNVNGIRAHGRIVDKGVNLVNTYYKSNFPRTVLKPGETWVNIYSINPALLSSLQHGLQYDYWITLDDLFDYAEANELNNEFKINFRMGY